MKNHTKVYLQKMGFDETEYIPCEVCQDPAVDIHHLIGRGSGGTGRNRIREVKNTKDYIENLVALCRVCHTFCETDKEFNNKVKQLHLKILKHNNICTE